MIDILKNQGYTIGFTIILILLGLTIKVSIFSVIIPLIIGGIIFYFIYRTQNQNKHSIEEAERRKAERKEAERKQQELEAEKEIKKRDGDI